MNVSPEVAALAVPVIRLLMLAFHAYVSAAIGGTVILRAALAKSASAAVSYSGPEELASLVYLVLQLLFWLVFVVSGFVLIYKTG